MRWRGGLPVDRAARQNLVQQAVDRFGAVDRLYLAIPPSRTRSRATHGKSGFYHIARGARIPIVCTFLDYRRRVGGIGPLLAASGDLAGDMGRIRAFYADIAGKFPALTTPARLLEEDQPGRQPG